MIGGQVLVDKGLVSIRTSRALQQQPIFDVLSTLICVAAFACLFVGLLLLLLLLFVKLGQVNPSEVK